MIPQVEKIVNEQVQQEQKVYWQEASLEQAMAIQGLRAESDAFGAVDSAVESLERLADKKNVPL